MIFSFDFIVHTMFIFCEELRHSLKCIFVNGFGECVFPNSCGLYAFLRSAFEVFIVCVIFYFLFLFYSGELVLARLRRDDHFGARFVIWCVVLKILCMQLERYFFKLTSHISPSTFFFFASFCLGGTFQRTV